MMGNRDVTHDSFQKCRREHLKISKAKCITLLSPGQPRPFQSEVHLCEEGPHGWHYGMEAAHEVLHHDNK